MALDSSKSLMSKNVFSYCYRICVSVEKKLKTTQMIYYIAKHAFLTVIRWIIAFVLILRKCCKPHNSNFKSAYVEKHIFCNGLQHLCCFLQNTCLGPLFDTILPFVLSLQLWLIFCNTRGIQFLRDSFVKIQMWIIVLKSRENTKIRKRILKSPYSHL